MLLLRVQLPDRPGSLGQVATAMGTVGADISAIEIVEKRSGSVVNDFMLTMPPHELPDSLVSVCNQLDGVTVLWLSRYPENWGLESDIDLLDRISADPENSSQILVSFAPVVFHSQWAAVVDGSGSPRAISQLAPELTPDSVAALGDLQGTDTRELPAGWLPGWGDTTIAHARLRDGSTLVLGRQGGPSYLMSELRRLEHLAGDDSLILQALVTWHQWVEVFSSIGYGVLSSIIPIFHTEAFIIAAVGAKVLGPVELSLGLAIGHAIGKQAMFLAVRHGKKLPWMRDRVPKPVDPDSWRGRWRRWSTKTAHLVENPRWGYPILFVSAASGIPPVYATVLFAGATKMNFWGFSATMLVGFFVRCFVLALGTLGAFHGIFG